MLYDWKNGQKQTRLIYGTLTTETRRKASAWLHNVILVACNSKTKEHKSVKFHVWRSTNIRGAG
jgi:hypothetical protein